MRKLTFLIAFFIASVSMAAVELAIVPDSPIVINNDFNYTDPSGAQVKVPAPWFQIQLSVTNNTLTPITLVAFSIDFGQRNIKKIKRELVLAPGEVFTDIFYIDSVPASATGTYVTLAMQGSVGATPGSTQTTLASTLFTIDNSSL